MGGNVWAYRGVGVSAFAKHHQLRRDLLVTIAVPKSSLTSPDADPLTRRPADPLTRDPRPADPLPQRRLGRLQALKAAPHQERKDLKICL
jgi:hypothetical protein